MAIHSPIASVQTSRISISAHGHFLSKMAEVGGEPIDSRDIAEAVDKYLINRIEHMVTSTDSKTSSPTTECKPTGVTLPQYAHCKNLWLL